MFIAWCTDIHLNFLSLRQRNEFYQQLLEDDFQILLIGGDIGEAPDFIQYLKELSQALDRTIYFVLGNHDYYRSSIAKVEDAASELHRNHSNIHWLAETEIVPLTSDIALVGHGGWGDGRYGDFRSSKVELNDFLLIQELVETGLEPDKLQSRLQELGDRSAKFLSKILPQALSQYSQVYVLTHVPPFSEACLYKNEPADDNWLPFFACQAVGDVLREMSRQYPDCQIEVLCGHSHHQADVQIEDNLHVFCGHAEYKKPQIARIFDIK